MKNAACFTKTMMLALIVVVIGVANPSNTNAQEGIGERIGESIDRGLDRLSGEIQENWASLRKFVDKLGVQGRVYSRLRWDKQLEKAEIEVDVAAGGTVRITGRVANAAAKEKAIELTKGTVGVTRVVDDLQVIGVSGH